MLKMTTMSMVEVLIGEVAASMMPIKGGMAVLMAVGHGVWVIDRSEVEQGAVSWSISGLVVGGCLTETHSICHIINIIFRHGTL